MTKFPAASPICSAILAATFATIGTASSQDGRIKASPLRARDAGAATRFVRHSAEDCGVTAGNHLEKQHILPYVYDGAGVATGDLDNDGLPDLYVVSQDGPNHLYRQTAPFKFEDVTEAAHVDGGDAWGTGCAIVDVDGDGLLDIYVCNLESPNLLYRNLGGMRFEECARRFGLGFVGASFFAAFADYDNDGDLDLYLVTNRVFLQSLLPELLMRVKLPSTMQASMRELAPPMPTLVPGADGKGLKVPPGYEDHLIEFGGHLFFGGQADRLFRNDGERFTDVTRAAGIRDHGMGLSATWWDFDDDGLLDLYVADDLESPDMLWHNKGDGTFEEVAEKHLPQLAYFGMGSDSADVDGDGRFDLLVADMAMRTHYSAKVLMGDMGDRGWFLEHGRPPQIMRNALFLNTGTDRFLECGLMAGVAKTDWTWTVKFGDLDCDGHVDLFATNGIPRFDNDPDAKMKFHELWSAGRRDEAVELAANLPPVNEKNLALRNDGLPPGVPPHFTDVASTWGLDFEWVSQGASMVDLDRDGDLDLVVGNLNAPVAIFENRTGSERHAVLLKLKALGRNSQGLGARISAFAGDRRIERLLTASGGYLSTHDPLVHLGLGDATRIDRMEIRWPGRRMPQKLDAVAADRLLEIQEPEEVAGEASEPAPIAPMFVETTLRPDFVHHETPFDDYAVQPLVPHRHSQLGPGIAIADVDGDGREDVFVGGARGQGGALFLRTDDGFAQKQGPFDADGPHEDLGVLLFDVDGDRDPDLYVVSGSNEVKAGDPSLRDHLYLNQGDGTFAPAPEGTLPGFVDSGGVVAAADYDGDGDLDLFVGGRVVPGRYPESPISRLYRNDGGKLVDVLERAIPSLRLGGLITSAIWSDYDDDGRPDLLVTAHWQPVRVFHNQGDGTFEDRTAQAGLAAFPGWWNGIAAGDLDGDGFVDYVTTNVGLDTKYKASADHPARIFAADFDDNGSFDVVEAKYEGDRLLPVRGRSCSSRAIPVLAERFKTYDQFARASLTDIYGDAALRGAESYEARDLAHVWWRNRGDGTFERRELPRLAQIAPAFGVVICDFDGDGRADVVLAQNFYGPEPETGRMAGGLGLLLRGTAQGLEPVAPQRSGILVPQDAKALAVTDLDGDQRPDLLITCNDAALRALRDQAPGARFAVVEVQGPDGNPTAVGARLTLRLSTGEVQVAEIAAGGGYLSASSPDVFFGLGAAESADLLVRWPDGARTTHRVTGPGRLSVHR
ncbi:MAG: FG-GAP-like repeat-containing protein [Planctomycetota bacterium]